MLVRRLFFRWQFIAVVVLPVWLLVGWGVFGGGPLGLLLLIAGCVALAVALVVVAGIIRARKAVRDGRAVSWWDVAALASWHLSIVGLGFFGPTTALFAVLVAVLAVAGFWLSLWQLFRETRGRVRATIGAYEREAYASSARIPRQDGDVIVIHEKD